MKHDFAALFDTSFLWSSLRTPVFFLFFCLCLVFSIDAFHKESTRLCLMCGLSERIYYACREPRPAVVDLNSNPRSLSLFPVHEEIRQDTVGGDMEFCLFRTYGLKGENRPLVALERKSGVTLKTIGPLPDHSAVLSASPHPSPVLFLPPLSMFQDCLAMSWGSRGLKCRKTISQHQLKKKR